MLINAHGCTLKYVFWSQIHPLIHRNHLLAYDLIAQDCMINDFCLYQRSNLLITCILVVNESE